VKPKVLVSIALFSSIVAGVVVAATNNDVPYPEGYRRWQHVKSMVIQEGHPLHGSFGGIHHLYGNTKAMEGYRTGKFADGSVIAFDLLEANAAGNAITEGKRKVLGVMWKDSKKYAATGGWGFEGFPGDSKTERAVGANAATACFGCHIAQKQNGYVFSAYRD
jgi:Cytochrome P460